MGHLDVLVYPVSFTLESGAARMVSLSNPDGTPLARRAKADAQTDAERLLNQTLESLLRDLPAGTPSAAREELRGSCSRFLELAGAEHVSDDMVLVYTSVIPMPFAEEALSVATGTDFAWRTISQSHGRASSDRPERRTGADSVVLEYWRQALEETDFALDFLPPYLSLLQLRGMYDAVWGYDQDPSGFRRWAIDRTGAFSNLLEEIADADELDAAFFTALADRLSPADAAKAGAMTGGSLQAGTANGLTVPIGLAAAASVNRLHTRRGPAPTWFRKTSVWRPGPTWIEHLYPPRPAWTRWRTDQFVD